MNADSMASPLALTRMFQAIGDRLLSLLDHALTSEYESPPDAPWDYDAETRITIALTCAAHI